MRRSSTKPTARLLATAVLITITVTTCAATNTATFSWFARNRVPSAQLNPALAANRSASSLVGAASEHLPREPVMHGSPKATSRGHYTMGHYPQHLQKPPSGLAFLPGRHASAESGVSTQMAVSSTSKGEACLPPKKRAHWLSKFHMRGLGDVPWSFEAFCRPIQVPLFANNMKDPFAAFRADHPLQERADSSRIRDKDTRRPSLDALLQNLPTGPVSLFFAEPPGLAFSLNVMDMFSPVNRSNSYHRIGHDDAFESLVMHQCDPAISMYGSEKGDKKKQNKPWQWQLVKDEQAKRDAADNCAFVEGQGHNLGAFIPPPCRFGSARQVERLCARRQGEAPSVPASGHLHLRGLPQHGGRRGDAVEPLPEYDYMNDFDRAFDHHAGRDLDGPEDIFPGQAASVRETRPCCSPLSAPRFSKHMSAGRNTPAPRTRSRPLIAFASGAPCVATSRRAATCAPLAKSDSNVNGPKSAVSGKKKLRLPTIDLGFPLWMERKFQDCEEALESLYSHGQYSVARDEQERTVRRQPIDESSSQESVQK